MKTWISVALFAFVCFFQKGECAITLFTSPNVANGGNGALATNINNKVRYLAPSTITITATSDHAGGVTSYLKVSQSPNDATDVVFGIDGTTGDISITSGTTDYATRTEYVFVVTANDADGTAQTATATLSVNNNPAFDSQFYGYCINDNTAAGATLSTFAASTTTATTGFTYAIATGNTDTDWAISSTGVVTVANALASTRTIGYVLGITATQSTLVGTTDVWIVVGCSGATAVLAGCLTLLMTLMAHLY